MTPQLIATMKTMISLRVVSLEELRRLIEEKSVSVLDANAPGRFARGHIPGATNVDPAAFSEGYLPSDRARTLVFYCTGVACGAARYAASRAAAMGYGDVRLFAGGITEWERAGLMTERLSTAGTKR